MIELEIPSGYVFSEFLQLSFKPIQLRRTFSRTCGVCHTPLQACCRANEFRKVLRWQVETRWIKMEFFENGPQCRPRFKMASPDVVEIYRSARACCNLEKGSAVLGVIHMACRILHTCHGMSCFQHTKFLLTGCGSERLALTLVPNINQMLHLAPVLFS